MTAHRDFRNPEGPDPVPDGLYVREHQGVDDPGAIEGRTAGGRSRRWNITGRNPEFWWGIVVIGLPANIGGYQIRCTRCGHRDQALVMDDLMGLIFAGAHFHDTDPAGGL